MEGEPVKKGKKRTKKIKLTAPPPSARVASLSLQTKTVTCGTDSTKMDVQIVCDIQATTGLD